MNPQRIRQVLMLLGLCILGGVTAVQLVQSVPQAVMFYLIGLALVLMVLEPFVGLVAYLIFYYLKPHMFIPGFANAPVMLVVGAAAFVSVLTHGGIRKRGSGQIPPQHYLLIWFFLANVMSHLSHGRVTDAISFGYDFLHTIVIYLVITSTVSSVRQLNIVVQCLAVLTLWLAVQGLAVHFAGKGIAGVEARVETDARVRALGFSGDPNLLAAGLLFMLPLFFLETLRPGSVARRAYSFVAMAVLCYVIFLTKSRGGALTLAVVGTLLLIRTVGLTRGVLLGLFLTLGIYFLGPSRVRELNPTEPSAFGRLLAWKRAFGEFQSSPLFGVGSHQSGAQLTGELVPHNAFLQVAAELGVFGLIPWVLLIFTSMKNAVFVRDHADWAKYGKLGLLAEALFLACTAWAISFLLVGSPYSDELYILLGLSVAAANIFVRSSQKHFVLIEKRDFGYAILIAGLGLALLRLIVYAAHA